MRVRLLVANICGAMLVAGAAQAADLATKMPVKAAPAPAFTWTGFYIGANAGYAWGDNNFSRSLDPLNPTTLQVTDAHYSIDGGLVGGQIGYNYQINNIVLGVEADAAWADISGSGSFWNGVAATCIQSNDQCTSKIDALGTITGRLGVAFDQVLLYAKGGAAWATTKHTAGYTDFAYPDDNYHASVSETRWGWTVGAGVEYAFTRNWSAKVEYNYIDLGNSQVTFPFFPSTWINPYTADLNQTLSIIKGGVNYRF